MRRTVILAAVVVCSTAGVGAALELGTRLVVPAAVRGGGTGGSVWRMDLVVTNPSDETLTVRLDWLERDADNSSPLSRTLTLPGGATAVLDDVVLERFGLTAGAGAIRLQADRPIAATSRIYNLLGQTTFGQGFDAHASGRAVGAGRTAVVPGLRQDSDARSNLFAVAGERGAELSIVVRQPFGHTLGTASYLVPRWGAMFVPVSEVAPGTPGNLVAEIEVVSGEAWIVGSRIDAGSGDPLTLSAIGGEAASFDGAAAEGTYLGEWVNLTFGSSGSAVLGLSVTPATGAATLQLDLDGPVLGGSDPPQDVLVGSFGSWGAELAGTSPTFGELRLEVGPDGRVSGGSDDVPGPSVDAIAFDGLVAGGVVSLTYTVDFAGSLEARGTLLAVR